MGKQLITFRELQCRGRVYDALINKVIETLFFPDEVPPQFATHSGILREKRTGRG